LIDFDFKNVGRPEQDFSQVSTKPFGIRTPWGRGDTAGFFDMHYDIVDQIKDNFKNLILTNKGERVMLPNFGGNLRTIVFENMGTSELPRLIAESIFDTTSKHMPYVSLKKLNIDDETNATSNIVIVKIIFAVPELTKEEQELALSIQV
jgi:phage baseplate assembly protein W